MTCSPDSGIFCRFGTFKVQSYRVYSQILIKFLSHFYQPIKIFVSAMLKLFCKKFSGQSYWIFIRLSKLSKSCSFLSFKKLCHEMNFCNAYNIKYVLSVHALIGFSIFCFLVDEKIKLKVLACFFWIYLLILKYFQ